LHNNHFQGGLGQFVRHVFIHSPANYAVQEQIQHTDQIQLTLIRPSPSNVYQPLGGGGIRRKIACQHIEDGVFLPDRTCSPRASWRWGRIQLGRAHQSCDAPTTTVHPLRLEFGIDPRAAISAAAVLKNCSNLF